MKTIIKKRKKTWIIFDDKKLNKSPIQRVITNDNNEEYKLGIFLLSKKLYALEECELVERVDIPLLTLTEFENKYAPT